MPNACWRSSRPSRKTSATRCRPRPATPPERNSVMADPVLKFPPEQKGAPANPTRKVAAEHRRRLMAGHGPHCRRLVAGLRRYRRFLLLVVLPLVLALAGFTFYLNGGGYVTTDDAYVGAQK